MQYVGERNDDVLWNVPKTQETQMLCKLFCSAVLYSRENYSTASLWELIEPSFATLKEEKNTWVVTIQFVPGY